MQTTAPSAETSAAAVPRRSTAGPTPGQGRLADPEQPAVVASAFDSTRAPLPDLNQTLPDAAARALAALGDAVALVHRSTALVRWTSPAWRRLLPDLGPGRPVTVLDATLHGALAAALAGALNVTLEGPLSASAQPGETARPLTRQSLAGTGAWQLQLASHDDQHAWLRLVDRHEQGRALQRQLDDREQLLFTSRVISVGEMASTLAHELNQPIGAAANLLRGLRARLVRRPRASGAAAAAHAEEAEALGRAIEQVMFASRVIGRIREFTHSHQPRQVRLDLGSLVRTSASLLDWDLRRSGAVLQLDLAAAPVCVRGDEVMLQQVVVNLMRNALDALRTDPPPEPRLLLRLKTDGQGAELQVQDNGCGLADDAAARLFVPFASSKPQGMGIGLSICRSFVELHQGRLWFSRPADRGACFHLRLPLLPDAAPPSPAHGACA